MGIGFDPIKKVSVASVTKKPPNALFASMILFMGMTVPMVYSESSDFAISTIFLGWLVTQSAAAVLF